MAAEDQGFVVVFEVDVNGVPLYGSAAILDHSFAQTVYVDDGPRGKDVPVGRDRDALFGDGSACRVDDSVRAVQRPGTTALFARTVRGRFVFDPFRFFRFRLRGGRLYGHGGDCRRLCRLTLCRLCSGSLRGPCTRGQGHQGQQKDGG